MSQQLFLFVQMEFPWELGPPDGRYLLRAQPGSDPERVIVMNTLGAQRRTPKRAGRSRSQASPEPAPVPTARVTVIDTTPATSEQEARAWLSQLDPEHEITKTVTVIGRVLFAHRISSADPHVHEISHPQALVIRAGFGEGEQVADGHWSDARELTFSDRRTRRRASALRSQERLAVLIGARGQALVCEELTLRARLDLNHGRLAHAAIELNGAYAAALAELRAENRSELATRLEELDELHGGVREASNAALHAAGGDPHEESLRHALERLEAALRARTAAGFTS